MAQLRLGVTTDDFIVLGLLEKDLVLLWCPLIAEGNL